VSAAELIQTVTQLGGRVTVEAGKLKVQVPADRADLLETLKANRDAVLEYLTTAEDSKAVLPKSPWLQFIDQTKNVWDALERQGTTTLNLLDENGHKVCHHFTASTPDDLRELATRGLKTFPYVQALTIIAVLPEVQIWQLEARVIN
jgi:hypothetical protein